MSLDPDRALCLIIKSCIGKVIILYSYALKKKVWIGVHLEIVSEEYNSDKISKIENSVVRVEKIKAYLGHVMI